MIRDKGPRQFLGYGTAEPGYDVSETGVNPESGIIAKALGGHPIASFFAASAMSMVGMGVASSLIRKGGIKFGENILARDAARTAGHSISATMFGGPVGPARPPSVVERYITSSLKDVRELRRLFEDWETNTLFRGIPVEERNLEFAVAEIQEARRLGRPVDPLKNWTMRDELKSRLLRQAKMMPYTLPGMYIADRVVMDPLLGKKSDVNWYNPVDVMGDFAIESVKNLSTMILPWELGTGAAKQGWGRLRLAGKEYLEGGALGNANIASQLLSATLEKVGQKSADFVSRGGMRGAQFLHAYSMGVRGSQFHQLELTARNGGRARSEAMRAMDKLLSDPHARLDASDVDRLKAISDLQIPGMFGGMHSFVQTFRSHWKLFNDELFPIINPATGQRSRVQVPGNVNINARFLNKTRLDDILESVQVLTGRRGGTIRFGQADDSGEFIQGTLKQHYRELFTTNLSAIKGVDKEAAEKVAELFGINSLPTASSVRKGEGFLSRRTRFTDRYSMDSPEALVSELTSPLSRLYDRRTGPDAVSMARQQAERIVRNLKHVTKQTDEVFVKERDSVAALARAAWVDKGGLFKTEVMPYIEGSVGTGKLPYNLFSGSIDQTTGHHVIATLAKEKGLTGIFTKPIEQIQSELLEAGIDINNIERVRAYLSRRGLVTRPWQEEGYNALGFRRVTVDELAGEASYYRPLGASQRPQALGRMWETLPAGERDRYAALLDQVKRSGGYSDEVGFLNQINLGSVWVSRTGQVLNLSPFQNAMRVAANVVADFGQIPLVHINPLKLGFFDAFRAYGQAPGVSSLNASGVDRFLPGQRPEGNMGYLAFQAGRKSYAVPWGRSTSSSGRRFAVGGKIHGVRTVPVSENSMLGNYIRNAIGDAGIAYDEQYLERSGLRQAFDVDRDQPSSLFRWFSRFKDQIGYDGKGLTRGGKINAFGRSVRQPGTPTNWDNPTALASWLVSNGENLDVGFSSVAKTRGVSVERVKVDFARSFDNMLKEVQARGTMSSALVRELSEMSVTNPALRKSLEEAGLDDLNPFARAFDVDMSDRGFSSRHSYLVSDLRTNQPRMARVPRPGESFDPTNPVLPDGFRALVDSLNLLDVEGNDVTIRRLAAEIAYARPREIYELTGQAAIFQKEFEATRSRLRFLLSADVDPTQPTGSRYRQVGIATRQQELREELYKVMISDLDVRSRAGAVKPGDLDIPKEPGEIVHRLLNVVEENKRNLSPKQYREMRMAALSIQAEQMRVFYKTTGSGAFFDEAVSPLEQTLRVAKSVAENPEFRRDLSSIADFRYRVPDEGIIASTKRGFLRRFSTGPETVGTHYNPFGGDAEQILLPTFSGAFRNNPRRAISSAIGLTTWSDPEALSTGGLYASQMVTRLNRYFGTFGLGIDPSGYKGPIDMFARGMVGKRVLPAVAAGALLYNTDALLGGAVKRDDQGRPIYSPLFLGMGADVIAGGQMAAAGLVPGGQTFEEKREELLEGEVPIRKGRWWLLGNTPFEGGRIMYHRPSWYRRFKSGWQYTGQLWDNPLEKLAFGYDFSPGRWIPGLNYHWERKHYRDRPYPVTGEMFTGPWGPVTGALNATIGRILKPSIRMHRGEVNAAMDNFATVGEFGAVPIDTEMTGGSAPLYVNDRGRMRIGYQSNAYQILNATYGSGGNQSVSGPILSAAGSGYGAAPSRRGFDYGFWPNAFVSPFVRSSYPQSANNISVFGTPQIVSSAAYSRSGKMSRFQIQQINDNYTAAAREALPLARRHAMAVPYYTNPRLGLSDEVYPNVTPLSSNAMSVRLSQFGYELQEMAGIYGFAFGSMREALGFGSQDLSPRRPVLTAASRAYGSERGFWDLQLGGLGDLPTPLEGDYSNLELSEIVRRFIPHRRRDIRELNPIPNVMGQEYPWLPGSDYFVNFKQGDPYTLIGEGELRLPGVAYERLHKLHPDDTGRYGMVDQFKILGDIAPWSDEYRSLSKVISKTQLNPDEQEVVTRTRRQVAARNRVHEFHPYRYANQNFETETVTITGRVENKADQFFTEEYGNRPIRLAGVRARSVEAQEYMDNLIRPGQRVQIERDAEAAYSPTLDVIMKTSSGLNINSQLAQSGFAFHSELSNPIDERYRTNKFLRPLKALGERIQHLDTFVNTKFMPYRTATEDWERQYVYNSTFSQWQHPIRDFLKPMMFKASTRNPIFAALATGYVGRLFVKDPIHKPVATAIGAAIGFTASVVGHIRHTVTGEPFIPEYRSKELALEESADIMKYVKYMRLYGQARLAAVASGEVDPETLAQKTAEQKTKGLAVSVGEIGAQALQFRKEIQRTMYGADPFGDVTDLMMAIPKRKREHFQAMMNAPVSERERILSTAGRLERRILQARWGMRVEKRPDLEDYFSDHELPPPEWEGWDPGVDMEMVKIKMMQHQGLDMSQIGYYPQQVQQANLINMSYPDFLKESSKRDARAGLRELMDSSGVLGNVVARPNFSGRDRIELLLGAEY